MRALLLSIALLATLPAIAADRAESPARMSTAPHLGNMDTAKFIAFHDGVRRDVDAGRYPALDHYDIAKIDEQEALIDARLAGKSLEQLTERERLDVFNAHERVVALINGDEEQRTVCRQEHQVGSHRPRVVCLTERDREDGADRNKLAQIHKGASID